MRLLGPHEPFLPRMPLGLGQDNASTLPADNPLTPAKVDLGRELFFGKAKCSQCHVGIDLTDELFHNIVIGMDAAELTPEHLGRYTVTGDEKDKGGSKTPSLRNIADTAPYVHDGSQATLLEVVQHHDRGGTPNPWLSEKIFSLELTDQEMQDVVQFMEEVLQGPVIQAEVPELPRPRARIAWRRRPGPRSSPRPTTRPRSTSCESSCSTRSSTCNTPISPC